MTETTVSDAPAEFVCPISLDIMKDPVMSRYGLNFEREAIVEWLQRGHEDCPITRRPLKPSSLVSNCSLREQICKWRHSEQLNSEEDERDFCIEEVPDRGLFGLISLEPELLSKMAASKAPTFLSTGSSHGCSGDLDDQLNDLIDKYDIIMQFSESSIA